MSGPERQLRDFVFHRTAGKDARSQARKDFDKLPRDARARLLQKMLKFSAGLAKPPRDFKPLGDGLFEIRVQLGTNPYRVLFFLDGDQPVALHCFHKKDQRLRPADLDVAKQRRKTWPRSDP